MTVEDGNVGASGRADKWRLQLQGFCYGPAVARLLGGTMIFTSQLGTGRSMLPLLPPL